MKKHFIILLPVILVIFTAFCLVWEYYFSYNVTRPTKNGFSVSKIYAVDPEKTPCTYKIQGGSGQKYFVTDRLKGGIRVSDSKYLNRHPGKYTIEWYAYDKTRLYAIAHITITVK